MSSRDKTIKAFAIGFGIFLIIIIMASILSVITFFLNVNEPSRGTSEEIPTDARKIQNIDVDLKAMSLEIVRGEEFKIKKTDIDEEYVDIRYSGNKLYIKESKVKFWSSKFRGIITIYVPNELDLNYLDINVDAGKVYIDDIKARELDLDQGAGTVEINSSSFDEASIDGGAGKIEISSTTLKNLELSSGVGSTSIEGEILGRSEIECGVGAIKLNLTNSKEDYTFAVEKGIGSIKIDGVDAASRVGSGENFIQIEGGVGSITVDFKN